MQRIKHRLKFKRCNVQGGYNTVIAKSRLRCKHFCVLILFGTYCATLSSNWRSLCQLIETKHASVAGIAGNACRHQ